MELLINMLIAFTISMIAYFIVALFFENTLSVLVAKLNYNLYEWIVYNRDIVLYMYIAIMLIIITYRFISKYVNNISEVYNSLDNILKEDNQTIKLSNDVNQFTEKINEIKYDYILTKKKKEMQNKKRVI